MKKLLLLPTLFTSALLLVSSGSCNKQECVEKPAPYQNILLCGSDYSPVCGCNQVQYENSCIARANNITNFTEGPCGI